MAKIGRPRWNPDDLKKVESLAAKGLTMEQIADALGIGVSTFHRKKSEIKEFKEAIKRGRSKGVATIANALFESAKQGNTTAQIFFLKSQAGWKETEVVESKVDANVKVQETKFTIKIPNSTRLNNADGDSD